MLGVLPFGEDPDLSWTAGRAVPQHLPPWLCVFLWFYHMYFSDSLNLNTQLRVLWTCHCFAQCACLGVSQEGNANIHLRMFAGTWWYCINRKGNIFIDLILVTKSYLSLNGVVMIRNICKVFNRLNWCNIHSRIKAVQKTYRMLSVTNAKSFH